MNAKEIFYNLTRGVHFKKRRLEEKKTQYNESAMEKVKEELNHKIDEQSFIMEEIVESNESNYERNDIENGFEFIKLNNNCKKEIVKKKKTLSASQKILLKESEQLKHFRKLNRISVTGNKNVPKPIQSFQILEDEYKVPKLVLDNLSICGFIEPTPIQMQATPIMLKGLHIMACAPTGSGKTVAFLIPIIRDLKYHQKKGFRAIILCPTRELAKQTYRESLRLTEKTGLKIHIISKVKKIEEQYETELTKHYDILISTPNRVRFLLQHSPPLIDLTHIEWFIIDEADKLLEDGKDNFKEQFDDIWNACSNINKKMGLFSATYTGQVAKWALKNIKNLVRVTIGERNSATSSVEQELLFVGNESGKLLAVRDMIKTGIRPPVLIFVQSKERAQQLFAELLYDGINVDVIHSDRSQQQRDNVVKSFREGKIWVLICTELMGRGIDFKGVNLVINYDFPPTSIAYIHRVGRTGRAGRKGKAVTFFTQDDQPNLRSIAHIIKRSGGKIPEFMLTLKKPKKSEKKKLVNHAPQREDITTTPKFVLERKKQIKESLSKNTDGFKNCNTKKYESFKEKLIVDSSKRKNFVLLNKNKTKNLNKKESICS